VQRFLARGSAFSYACQGCGRCCRDKRITLTPYEIARLARALGVSTREVLLTGTSEGGTALRFAEGPGGACVYLEGARCAVHEGRPLACRLYPLGRQVLADGESFVALAPHPETEGVYGQDGDVWSFVEAQGAAPFIDAAARYEAVFRRMIAALESTEGGDGALSDAMRTDEPVASDWLDVDAVVARACRERGVPEPAELEERIALHLDELERWVASAAGSW
jgi:Fe-S-cluster containining protein